MEDNRLYLQSEVEESEGSNDNRVGLTLEEQNTRIPSFQAVDSSKCSNMVSDIEMDYSTEFTTDEIFKSKDDMVQWTREVGMRNGIVVVIKSSDAGTLTRRPRVTFGCERGGTYRAPKQKGDVEIPIEKRRNTGTKKCGCPFTLKGQKLATDDDWSLKVVCGVHNHPTVTYHEGHPFSGRLSSEETSLLADMSISLVRPKDILVTLKSRDPDNSSTIKAIYNVRQRLKVAEKAGRLHMQALLGKLAEKNYLEFHQSCGDTDYVQDLFWAHPIDIDLLRTFPRVLIMDCTHKTSRYKLPLFEIVGITSTDKTFVVAFAFLCDEKEDNYRWALDRLRTLMDPNDLPQVIVTDRELALMNAVAKVFPRARHMICSWHVEKNIASKCKNFFGTKREWDKFNSMWNLIVYASTEEEYNSHVSNINVQFNSYPDAIKYVTDNWLNPYKEKFVAAWTDRHMHFGNTTMNRVESAHARLKKQLGSSQGNFETTWTAIDGLLELLHTNIKASFEESKTVVQHNYQPALFRDLRGCISMTALDLVLAQSKRADSVGVDARVCGCVIRRTHGLPCAHEIADYKREGRPIPLESIDVHWTRLSMVPMKKMGISCQVELDLINDRFNALDESAQKHLLQKLRELASPETTTLVEPHVKTKSRGRPLGKKAKVDTSTKCEPSSFEYEDLVPSHEDSVPTPINFDSTLVSTSNTKPMLQRKSTVLEKVHRSRNLKPKTYLHSFPAGLLPYISHIEDVPGDGNCGYRAIAGLMGFGQNEWARVRRDLSKELHAHIDDYRRIIWATDDIGEVERRLDWFDEHNPAPYEKWLLLPEMGFLISSCYNVVLYLLSASICCTFLPLRTVPESIESRVEIAIGFVNGNHFIQVYMSPGHPVPPIAHLWEAYARSCAHGWADAYMQRIDQFKNEVNPRQLVKELISLESDNEL